MDYRIIGSCINCTAPGSLLATSVVLFLGLWLAVRHERKKVED